MWEFYTAITTSVFKLQKYIGIITGIILFTGCFLYTSKFADSKVLLPVIVLVVFIFISELYLKSTQPFMSIAYTLLSIIWIAVPVSLMNFLVFPDITSSYTPVILLGFFFLTWANDSFAYIFGVTLGKHRLFERISPKKSWEGSVGGMLMTLITAYIISIFFTGLTMNNWLIIASIIVVAGTFGDLAESLFKRSFNIKDSGSILPGHGGILDRFDSAFIAIPCVFTYLQIIK